jgi:FKBP-type peptidyl-prolyl cis-trans isomerase 2
MPEKTKKGDFVEVEYTGMVKEDKSVFDTTDAETAKKEGFYNPKHDYSAKIVCIGQGQLLKGLDDFAVGKEAGKEYEVFVNADDGFGKKSAKMMKLVPTKIFTKDNINPVIGLPVNIDGMYGIIRTVTGGRVIVDFNHPLSGKDLIYKFKIKRIVADDREKLESFLSMELGLEKKGLVQEFTAGAAKIKIKRKIPPEIAKVIEKKVSEIIPSVKKLDFVEGKEQQNT